MWIVLQGPNGRRRVPENTPYRMLPGEQVIGAEQDATETELNEELAKRGMRLGDLVEKMVKASHLDKLLGKEHCTPCSERKRILNQAHDLGVRETVQQLLGTFKDETSRTS